MPRIANFRLTIGDVDVSDAITNGSTRQALDERNSAEFVVDVEVDVVRFLDFSGEVIAESFYNNEWYLIFAGGVRRVVHGGATSKLYCEGAQGLIVTATGLVVHRDCNLDVIESLVQAAGIPHDIEGLPDRYEENFEILVPATQIDVPASEKIGNVAVVSVSEAAAALERGPELPVGFRENFLSSPAYMRTTVRSISMYDAQVEGVARIEQALAGLVVGSRYSLFRYPSGEAVPWRRELYQFNPVAVELVLVASTSSPRFWIRKTGILALSKPLSINDAPLSGFEALTHQGSLQLRQAFLLCRRAAMPGTPVDRITALWQGLEFLVSKQRNHEPVFDRESLEKIQEHAKDSLRPILSDTQWDRIESLIGKLNDPPLLTKLRQFFTEHSIPVLDAEITRLWKLRSYRNKVNHGKEPIPPLNEEIDFGVALMARILVYTVMSSDATL